MPLPNGSPVTPGATPPPRRVSALLDLRALRSRKLAQWAMAYLAGAWLVLQLIDIVGDSFGWSDSVGRIATLVLGMGFLAVLVLAWYHGEKGRQRASGIELLLLTAILAGAALAVGFLGRPGPGPNGAAPPPLAAPPSEAHSIAVLPFVNMSSDPEQEYFSDGLTEELLNVLARVPDLRVASRTSSFAFREAGLPVDSIARVLRVAHVLEGSVRKSGGLVRITAQLIHAGTGYHLWSEAYDRELRDVFAVQDEIARAIVASLKLTLDSGAAAGAPLARVETQDPEAHTLVLKGAHFARQATREGYRQAVTLLQEAVERDPAYARAYAELARAFSMEAYLRFGPREPLVRQAKDAARHALTLDPTLAEAHFAAADIAQFHEWDFPAAERHFRRAIELNPGLAYPRSLHGWLLMRLGRPDEALDEARRAAALDPVSAGILANLGALYTLAGDYDLAIEASRAALALDPDDPMTMVNLGIACSEAGHHDEAVDAIEDARVRAPDDQLTLAYLAYIHGRSGDLHRAREATRTLENQAEPSPYLLATAYAGLGEGDRVLALLERAVEEKDGFAPDMGVDPTFAPYRRQPRFQALIERIGLPPLRPLRPEQRAPTRPQ